MTRVEIAHFKNLIAARTDPLTGKPKAGYGANVAMLRKEVDRMTKEQVDKAPDADDIAAEH